MANCKKCGAALREGAKFCAQCGTAVINDVFCSACGEKLEAGDKFCIYCGTPVKAAAPAAVKIVKSENEYPAWQSFAALWDVDSVLTVGAGSPEGHYLTGRTRSEMLRVDEDGVKAEYIPNPEGVLGFYSKLWKNGKLWLSALMDKGANNSALHRIYSYTPAEGFNTVLDISNEEYGDLDIVRFIVTEACIFLFCFNSKRREDGVSLITCAHDGSGLRELWRGEDFLMRGAGMDKLYMVCQSSRNGREVLVVSAGGVLENAADVLSDCLPVISEGIGVEAGETKDERSDFCWKYIPFIDFAEGVVYAALDEGGTENLTRRVWSVGISGGELKSCGEKWQLGDIDPTENFREYFDGQRAVGFSYGNPGGWTAVHADGKRVYLGDGSYWDAGAVVGDYFYLDCCSSDPGTWYKIDLGSGKREKLEF